MGLEPTLPRVKTWSPQPLDDGSKINTSIAIPVAIPKQYARKSTKI